MSAKPELFCLLVCGLPGSGKSTVSTELEKVGWVRVNQDDLGLADECKKLMEKSLKHNKSVVLDRCNVHPKERRMWIQIAKQYTNQIEVLFMNTDPDECKRRAKDRKNHPTLSEDNVDDVIDQFLRGMSLPEAREGFSNVMIANDSDEAKALVKQLKTYPVSKSKK